MRDRYFIELALAEAKKALATGEIPVGACLVKEDQLLFADHNRTKSLSDPTAHAEKLVLERAAKAGMTFLNDCTLYVTLEPCLMCSGAIILRKVGRVVFGAYDPKTGAAGSIYNTLLDKRLNHNPMLKGGVLAEECALILTDFFQKKR